MKTISKTIGHKIVSLNCGNLKIVDGREIYEGEGSIAIVPTQEINFWKEDEVRKLRDFLNEVLEEKDR